MKLKRRISLIALCALLLAGMTGCKKNEEVPTEPTVAPTTEAPMLTAREKYAAARAAVDSASDLSVRITTQKSTAVGGEVFLENSEKILSITGRGTAAMKILLGESTAYGDSYGAVYQETYADGMLYMLLDGSYRLSGNVDAQSYVGALPPAVLLDASLYGSVEYSQEGVISFNQPQEAESWALPEGAAFGNATGTAVIAEDGTLTGCSYSLTYDYGTAQVTESIMAMVTLESAEILVPGDAAKYTKVQDISAVRMAKQAMGMLKQANSISAAGAETISSMATGMMRSQNTMTELNRGSELSARIATNVMLGSYLTNESQAFLQEEVFQNGMYTVSANGAEPVQKPEVTADVITKYCTTNFEMPLIAPEFWKDAKVMDMGGHYMVECTFNEALVSKLRSHISQTMFSDAAALEQMAPNSLTVGINGYFAVDKCTGLPLAASYRYAATDIMEEQEYMTLLEASQTYRIAGLAMPESTPQETVPAETAPAETVPAAEETTAPEETTAS